MVRESVFRILPYAFAFWIGTAEAQFSAMPPSYAFQEHRFVSPADSGHCGKPANAAVVLGKVRFAQTHFMEPSWPLFSLTGGRPALVAASLSGSGKAPDVRLTAKSNGIVIGQACLSGPADVPANTANTAPSFDNLYTMTLPSAWVKPGLSVTLEVGSNSVEYAASQLAVASPTELNLLMIETDLLHYNDGKKDAPVPSDFLANFAAAMPASVTRLGRLPARLVLDRMVFAGSADEPVLACRTDVPDRTGCADYSTVGGMDQLAAVMRMTGAVSRATGAYSFGYTYGNTEHFAPGGWGGGKVFAGFDYGGIFLHEMGHALGLPHWGQGSYGNTSPTADEFTYPYGGVTNDGGGRGQTWNYEPNTREFISPVCVDKTEGVPGQERSDAMQRNHPCQEARKSGTGPWDGFGDFSAKAIQEFLHGNTGEHVGTVPYFGANQSFHLPERAGFPTLETDPSGNRTYVRGATQPQTKLDEEKYDFLHPVQWNVPVYTVYGTYHPQYRNVNILYRPMAYMGTMPKLLDPSDPKIFADLKAAGSGPYGGYFWWAKDVTLRFTYADGSQRLAIYPYDGVGRDWSVAHHPWRWDLLYFAINIPADKKLSKVEVFRRPFLVRYSNMTDSGNIAYTGSKITSQNFLDGAELMSSRTFTDVVPPADVARKERRPSELEELGGTVTVGTPDGRIAKSFTLTPGEGLEAKTRQILTSRGVWVVRLETRSGSFSRIMAIQ
jgi:hypothetical protein